MSDICPIRKCRKMPTLISMNWILLNDLWRSFSKIFILLFQSHSIVTVSMETICTMADEYGA